MKSNKDLKPLAFVCGLSLYFGWGIQETFWTPFLPSEFARLGISQTSIGVVSCATDATSVITCVVLMMIKLPKNYRPAIFSIGG